MMTATPNDVRFANDVCLAAHFMANIASLQNEVEQHHICEANASYRRRRCFIVIRGQIRTATQVAELLKNTLSSKFIYKAIDAKAFWTELNYHTTPLVEPKVNLKTMLFLFG